MEPETPQTPLLLPEHAEIPARSAKVHGAGIFSLGLMFVASALFTGSYLQSTAADAPRSLDHAAQTATVTASTVETPPIIFASSTLQAQAAYVFDMTDQRVLYSLNPDAQLPLASITKVPMALVVSEVLTPDTQITIPYDVAGLTKGNTWRAGDVIDFTLAASSNGGAEILADAADNLLHARYPQSPTEGTTLWRMNDLAQQLGLSKTYFLNVSGLDESTTQSGAYGSARDVAQLFAYAASASPQVFAATTQPSFSLISINGAKTMVINTDKALDAIPGIIMGKTGYTDLASGNLAVVFSAAPNHPVVAVVLGSTEQGRFEDMKKIVAAVQSTLSQ